MLKKQDNANKIIATIDQTNLLLEKINNKKKRFFFINLQFWSNEKYHQANHVLLVLVENFLLIET
jgi:hypothetical protein